MMHTSKVKFGARAASEFTSGACSGPVKVSYFDPETGKPCASKPKPLGRREQRGGEQKKSGGTRETHSERSTATARPRRRARGSRYKPKRNELGGRANAKPVYVDGKLYLSVREAAEAVGGNTANLATALRKGAAKYKGHEVRSAL